MLILGSHCQIEGSYLLFNDCRVVFQACPPLAIGFGIPDDHQATAGVRQTPLDQRDNVLNDGGTCVCDLRQKVTIVFNTFLFLLYSYSAFFFDLSTVS